VSHLSASLGLVIDKPGLLPTRLALKIENRLKLTSPYPRYRCAKEPWLTPNGSLKQGNKSFTALPRHGFIKAHGKTALQGWLG